MSKPEIYSSAFQKNLFGEMSRTYGLMNLVASFGFSAMWRSQCVRKVKPKKDAVIVDLMTGMGELFHNLNDRFDSVSSLRAIDFSKEMCERARKNAIRWPKLSGEVLERDVFNSQIPDASVDFILCSFGLKTLSQEQQNLLAKEIQRMLKPGGQFSFVEISVPPNLWMRLPFLFYLRHVVPFLGKLFLGNPANYRMLAKYTENFGNAGYFASCLKKEGLMVESFSPFFGCASGVSGTKQ